MAGCASQEAADNEPSLEGYNYKKMMLTVPGVLVDESTAVGSRKLNLEDPEQVARALGIELSGDNKQVLYVIAITAPTAEQGIVKREVPIRVDNIKDGAHMIRQWQAP